MSANILYRTNHDDGCDDSPFHRFASELTGKMALGWSHKADSFSSHPQRRANPLFQRKIRKLTNKTTRHLSTQPNVNFNVNNSNLT